MVCALVFTSTLLRTRTLPSPTHLCTFVHSSCEVQFWGREHNSQQEDCYDFDEKVTEYRCFPKLKTRDSRSPVFLFSSHLLYISIFLYHLSEKKGKNKTYKKKCKWMKERFMRRWTECSSCKRNPVVFDAVLRGLAASFPLYATNLEIIGGMKGERARTEALDMQTGGCFSRRRFGVATRARSTCTVERQTPF